MAWAHFEGKARSRQETAAYLATLHWTDWKPQGLVLHNTSAPTLKQWAESGPNHDARIRNLQSYYEDQLGWHAGPHFFISRNWINWFSNPLRQGVHSRCWNGTRFGIEQVGEFNIEDYNSGDGAMVRDNAVFLVALLNNRFGWHAEDFVFHIQCTRDNHDCPGRSARNRPDLIARIKAQMVALKTGAAMPPQTPTPPPTPTVQQGPGAGVPTTPPHASPSRNTGILMTEFAGPGEKPGDRVNGYTGKQIDWRQPGVALPYHFTGSRPRVRIIHGDRKVECDIVDIGPWTTHVGMDQYWRSHERPKAESHHETNGAGIDATPGTFEALGIPGKLGNRSVRIDWDFAP